MERLCKEDRKELVWGMRKALMEQVGSAVLTESASVSAENFILNEATYEQLLNLCFNSNREEKYFPASVLEQVAVEVYEQYVEEAEGEEKQKGKIASAWGATKKGVRATGSDIYTGIRHPISTVKSMGSGAREYTTSDMFKKGVEGKGRLKKFGQHALHGAKGAMSKPGAKSLTAAAVLIPTSATVARKIYKKQKAKKSA